MIDESKIEKSFSNCLDMLNESFIHPTNYILNQKVKIYEDDTHEFKMYKFKDDSDIYSIKWRLNKYLCAFLNSNSGVLYLGINDDAEVKGIFLEKKMLKTLESTLNDMINSFDKQVKDNNLITFNLRDIYSRDGLKQDNLYIVEIVVKQGLLNQVYVTDEGECYIKLNGTVKHISMGNDLFRYLKNKIKKYYLKN